MKKNLIVIVALVLIMTHVIPPYNIILANDEVNECENMDFTVQTIKENDEKISGTAQPSEQLEIEFKTKNKTAVVNADTSGKFELEVEEEFLEAGDVITISNDYFKIDTKVTDEGTTSESIQSSQDVECPVLVEGKPEEAVSEEDVSDSEESLEELVSEEDVSDPEETLEELVSEEDVSDPEETPEEAVSEEDVSDSEETPEEGVSEEDISDSEESLEELVSEEDVSDSEKSLEELVSEEDVSDSEKSLEELVSEEGNSKTEEILEEALENSSSSDVIEDVIREKEIEETVVDDKSQKERKVVGLSKFKHSNVEEIKGHIKKELKTTNEIYNNNQEKIFKIQNRLADIELLGSSRLVATVLENQNIELQYTGRSLVSLGLGGQVVTFYIPPEIINEVTKIDAKYKVPEVEILGIVLAWGEDNFDSRSISQGNNYISLSLSQLVTLGIVSLAESTFTLRLELENIPSNIDGEYIFHSIASQGFVDLTLLSKEGLATDSIQVPKILDSPIIDSPIYNTDEVIRGTGEPNTRINITSSATNKVYIGIIDNNGNFTVPIDSMTAGTEIWAYTENDNGDKSEEISTTVIQRLNPPEITPLYNNDRIVTGTGKENTKIILSIGDETYESFVNSDGFFSFDIQPQLPGTVITAVLIDEFGGDSEIAETTVLEGVISFHEPPPDISFDTTQINSNLRESIINRQDKEWSLKIYDTRRPGSEISILAEVTKPLTSITDATHVLSNSLIYKDENLNIHSLEEEPQEVFSGTTQEESIQSFSWEDGQGILIEVNPLTVRPESYSGTINWTISNGP